jgi:hypothetical protein
MPSEGFEFAIPAIKRRDTYVLDRTVTGIGGSSNNNDNRQAEPKNGYNRKASFEFCSELFVLKYGTLLLAGCVYFYGRLLVNKTNRRTEFQFYWYYDSTLFGQSFRPSSGVLSGTSALVQFMQFGDRLLPGAGWNCSSILRLVAPGHQTA